MRWTNITLDENFSLCQHTMAGRLTTPRLYPIMKEELRQVMNVVKIRQNDGAYEKNQKSVSYKNIRDCNNFNG